MDWIVGGIIAVGTLWLASHALDHRDMSVSRCARCGAPLEVTEQGLELLRLGLLTALPASCSGCGMSGELDLGMQGDEPWAQ